MEIKIKYNKFALVGFLFSVLPVLFLIFIYSTTFINVRYGYFAFINGDFGFILLYRLAPFVSVIFLPAGFILSLVAKRRLISSQQKGKRLINISIGLFAIMLALVSYGFMSGVFD